ncbi:LysR family transcriptional regulator [Stenotrophomonas tumulicola]|uniref:LysR family transcriptional regulator n=1 Tax=Stenotrophomonas tumulicola TaxID=1685415 RepID=A0A7W3FNH2_9GAMM|nr:LysR family transcriptional regulator [Stenotrophomonas tumulicola]MBA8682680.1 LysR family transcriptional regulator [Stenotrophomonas tumulicola]
MRLTLRQLQVFVAIADEGSTHAAGLAVALSQSASSAALQELESHFGTPLFDRIGRRLVINGHGRALLEPARVLLANAAGLERQLASGHEAGRGMPQRLLLAASTTIGNYLLPPRIAALLRQVPKAEVDLRIDNSAGVVAAVQQLQVDAGLIEGPCHARGLQVLPWQQDPLVVVAAVDAPPRWTLAALRRARWLLREPGSGTREVVDQLLLPHLQGFGQSLQLGNTEAIKQAAIAGLGLACLSRHAVEDALALGHLQVLATPLPALRRQLWLVRHPGKRWLPGLDALLGPLPGLLLAR